MKKLLIGKDVRVVHKNDPLKITIKDAFIMDIIADNEENCLMTLICDKENGAMVYTNMSLLRFKDTHTLQQLILDEVKKIPENMEFKELDSRFRFMDFSGSGLIGVIDKEVEEQEEDEEEEEDDWKDDSPEDIPF